MKFETFVFDRVLIESLFDRFWFFFLNKQKEKRTKSIRILFFYFSYLILLLGKGVSGTWPADEKDVIERGCCPSPPAPVRRSDTSTRITQTSVKLGMEKWSSSTYFTSFLCLHDGTRQSTSSTSHPIIDRSWWLFDRVIESNLPPIKKRHVYWPSHKV